MNKYIEERMIGQGSFGQVFLVRRRSDNLKLVMKKIRIGNVSDKEMEAFNLEIRLLSELVGSSILVWIRFDLHSFSLLHRVMSCFASSSSTFG